MKLEPFDMERKNEFLGRTYVVLGLFGVLAFVILFKVFKVTIIEGEKWRSKGGVNVKYVPITSERGNIYASDGRLLATSLPHFEVRMDMSIVSKSLFNEKVDSLSYLLSAYIDNKRTPSEWKRRLVKAKNKKRPNKYLLIARNLDFEEMMDLKSFPIFRKGRYGGGLRIITHSRRAKPFGMLASRTVGVDRENAEKVGLEGYFDKVLKGKTDEQLMKKISDGIWVPLYDPSEFGLQKGADLVTNLDMDIQDVAESSLTESIRKYDAKGGTAIVMEVKTGKIVAMANLTKDEEGDIYEGRNFAVGRLSEPGSTMKTASVLAMLEDGYIDEDTEIDLYGGKRKFYSETMYDSHMHGKRKVSVKEAFSMSSNVGIGGLAFNYYEHRKMKRGQFTENLRRFGLGSQTGVEIVGEATPEIKDPEKDSKVWWGTTIPWMAHGYEMQLTPLQVLRFYNAIANDGVMMKPYLVSDILGSDGFDKHFKPKVVNAKIASLENIHVLQDMLADVVHNGTAKSLKTKKYNFSGKTGTTRVNYDSNDDRKVYNASFSGYFPSEDPMYSVMVVVYDPKTAYYGSSVAGSVFRAIGDKCFATKLDLMGDVVVGEHKDLPGTHKGYKKDFENVMDYVGMKFNDRASSDWVKLENEDTRMSVVNQKFEEEIIPDVRGMGMRDAVYLLESIGLKVETIGYGRVATQSIRPGTKAVNQEIKIKFR